MQVKRIPIFLFLSIIVFISCSDYQASRSAQNTINSINTIVYDMEKPHEGTPRGVPMSYDWAFGPRIGMGKNPQGFKAMSAWGQLYEASEGNPARNTRVQIRNLKAYVLSKKDGKWNLLQSSASVEGAAYQEDFAGDINKPADVRNEQDGGISAVAGDGHNFHFWSTNGRVAIDPDDVAGVFTTVQARLVVDTLNKSDDRVQARYLLSMGGDYWRELTAQWENFKTNGDIGIGKFKYVKDEWQAFNMTTLSPDEIRQNPPPLE